jgi:hypothetical protein
MGGINASVSLAAMAPTDAVYAYNLHSSNMGLRVRDGWEEWVAPASAIGAVRTIIPFGGNLSDASDAKLFCATPGGIYDVTASGTAATLKVAFGTTTGRAGWGSFSNFQLAGGSFIAYCDEANGYYRYTASTNTWAKVYGATTAWAAGTAYAYGTYRYNGTNVYVCTGTGTSAASGGPTGTGTGIVDYNATWDYVPGGIIGADPATFAQVLSWKNRLWFVQKDSAQAWYLPVNQYGGTVGSFGFGSKFPQGGALASIANWTRDGGAGADDFFVAVSNAGDVAMYQGTDPAFADTFGLQGYWNVGKVPPGRRFIWDAGSDLLILSSRGLTSMVSLLTGTNSSATPDFFLSFKVGNLIGTEMAAKLGNDGWSVHLHPRRDMIIITVPRTGSEAFRQYAMYSPVRAWSVYRDIPMLCQGTWNGEHYFGTADGRVCLHAGTKDAVTLAGGSTEIAYSGCGAFTDLGAPGKVKRVGLVKPILVSRSRTPMVDVKIRWDFDQDEIGTAPTGTGTAGTVFDTALWDTAVWSGTNSVSGTFRGAEGMGYRCAAAFRGVASVETVLVSIEVIVEAGGLL